MTREFLLGDEWLETYVLRLDAEGLDDREISEAVNRWVLAVIKYIAWLDDEGYSSKEGNEIINSAVENADFDFSKFPVCPGDE